MANGAGFRKEGMMSKVIYRGFEAGAQKQADGNKIQTRNYRGVQYVPTAHEITLGKTGNTKLLYRGVVAA